MIYVIFYKNLKKYSIPNVSQWETQTKESALYDNLYLRILV